MRMQENNESITRATFDTKGVEIADIINSDPSASFYAYIRHGNIDICVFISGNQIDQDSARLTIWGIENPLADVTINPHNSNILGFNVHDRKNYSLDEKQTRVRVLGGDCSGVTVGDVTIKDTDFEPQGYTEEE